MQDADAALQTALEELRAAEGTLPDELQARVREVIEKTSAVLEALREPSEPA